MFRPISSGFLAVSFREKKAFRFDHSFLGIDLDAGFQRWNHRVFSAPKRWGNASQFWGAYVLKWVALTNNYMMVTAWSELKEPTLNRMSLLLKVLRFFLSSGINKR